MNTQPIIKQQNIEPGIYDISNDAYHQGPGISRTAIMELKTSAKHYWNRYLDPDRPPEKEKKCFDFGQALHTLVLEPEEFDNRFVVIPHINGTTKAGREFNKELATTLNGRGKIIEKLPDGHTDSDYQALTRMTKIIKEEIFPIFKIDLSRAKIEKSLYWIDEETGVLCKCRPDLWQDKFVIDIKGEKKADERSFSFSAKDHGYHVQVAMIKEALKVLYKIKMSSFEFVVIEKKLPHAYGIYSLDEASIALGHEIFKQNLRKYKACLEANNWPRSYGIQEITLPRYAFN